MGRIVVSENISLDGVIQDPTGGEGFAHGGWFNRISDEDRSAWAEAGLEEDNTCEALLMGRRSYEYLAARWPSRTGQWADRLSALPKYVVSTTLRDPVWHNTTVLAGDVYEDVAKLKESVEGDIVVNASGRLVPRLLAEGLVDELRLMVFPFLLGGSTSLFRKISELHSLHLDGTRRVGASLVQLTYRVSPAE